MQETLQEIMAVVNVVVAELGNVNDPKKTAGTSNRGQQLSLPQIRSSLENVHCWWSSTDLCMFTILVNISIKE